MDEDYDPMADEPDEDDRLDDYDQDGPDLFGESPVPAPGPAEPSEPTPSEEVGEEPESGEEAAVALNGPETPAQPDGLESQEDDAGASMPHLDVEPDPEQEPVETAPAPAPFDNEPPLALYRRYRPETFDEVIGQEHVTEPLKRAILNNRVNHAYLFSGPRGCGKTTSARILARALNCEKGPTPTPCGVCQSCRDLGRGGPGSMDVIEIDAASHGGVDDARDLRESAFFAPVSSRYKIYIIDEAHMVTTQGFNALLKLVEEPPPHVKFIFATTEPDKVIGTIRSRTHHYPFRLVPPKTLAAYLEKICTQEGVAVDRAVLPLVVRAGGGSVRDSLSVLDQLLGGAEVDGVSYEQAAALLGYTPDALLDQIVDAFAAGDAHEVFATIDKVIEVGQDPRRFAEDLLRRMRDLVILSAVPDACSTGLIDASPEQAVRLSHQVAGLGSGELTRAAEVLATGLTQMRGTTAPRLHLELMCSRILLPGADAGDRGVNARLERLERRVGVSDGATTGSMPQGTVQAPPPLSQEAASPVSSAEERGPRSGGLAATVQGRGTQAPAPDEGSAPRQAASEEFGAFSQTRPQRLPQDARSPQGPVPQGSGSQSAGPQGAPPQGPVQAGPVPQGPGSQGPGPQGSAPSAVPPRRRRPRPSSQGYAPGGSGPVQQGQAAPQSPAAQQNLAASQAPISPSSDPRPAAAPSAPAGQEPVDRQRTQGQVDIAMLRREWPQVLDAVKSRGRVVWMVLSQYAQVTQVNGREVTVAFANPGARDMFINGPLGSTLHDAVLEVLGADLSFTPVLGGGQGPAGPAAPEPPSAPGGPYGPSNPGGPGGPGGSPGPSEPGRERGGRPGDAAAPHGLEPPAPRDGSSATGPDAATPSAATPSAATPSANTPQADVAVSTMPIGVAVAAPVSASAAPAPAASPASVEDPRPSSQKLGSPDSAAGPASAVAHPQAGYVSGPVQDPPSPQASSPFPPSPQYPDSPDSAAGPASAVTPGEAQAGLDGHDVESATHHVMTHRWSERARESIRATSHHVEEQPPDDEPPEDADWEDSQIVEEPQVSPVQLIVNELGGVVIEDPLAQQQ